MNVADLTRFGDAARVAGVDFYFSGHLTPSSVAVLGAALRRRLEEREIGAPVRRRIFSAFVEMAQNVLHYAAVPDEGAAAAAEGRPGAIAMGTAGGEHWIACTNAVRTELVPRLAERLEAIRKMSSEELRAAYKRQLDDDRHEVSDAISRGAGLGLLTIARAASAPLEHGFEPIATSGSRLTQFTVCARLRPAGASRLRESA